MPVEILVPVFGESVVEATVGQWFKREGEAVGAGEPVVELETEKVNTSVSASESGTIARILRPEGETVRPGDVLALLEPGAAAAEGHEQSAVAEGSAAAPKEGPPVTARPADRPARPSPVAERLAAELGVNISEVPGTGPGRRIMKEDVEGFARQSAVAPLAPPAPASPTATEVEGQARRPPSVGSPSPDRAEIRQRLSRRRLTIARRLVEAQHNAAMLTTFNEIDIQAVVELRRRRREGFRAATGVDLGYMSFFVKATIGALKAFPQLNAEIQGDDLILKQYYDIGIAIGDPEGLVVPVLRDADRMTFAEIENAIARFSQKVKERTLSLEDLRGGTFTITNGGVFGSLFSTPILNPPQVGILGLHKIGERAVVIDGQVVARPMMFVALSYDHRVVDGRGAVLFLVRIKELIEDPERLLLEG